MVAFYILSIHIPICFSVTLVPLRLICKLRSRVIRANATWEQRNDASVISPFFKSIDRVSSEAYPSITDNIDKNEQSLMRLSERSRERHVNPLRFHRLSRFSHNTMTSDASSPFALSIMLLVLKGTVHFSVEFSLVNVTVALESDLENCTDEEADGEIW